MTQGFKTSNDYAAALDQDLYADTPKAVFAAIAVSLIISLGAPNDEREIAEWLVTEWDVLHQNGIVPQVVPGRHRHLSKFGD